MVTGKEQLSPYTRFPFVTLKGKRETAKEPLYRKLFFGYELSILQYTPSCGKAATKFEVS
jgi:hypothetical protein